MLAAKDVSVTLGGQTVLGRISVSVGAGTRIGVVGPNGIGKSTLLRVLAGMVVPDQGSVSRTPAGLKVGYLAQEPDAAEGETLLGYLARRTGVAEAEARLDALTDELAGDPGRLDDYTEALEEFLSLGGDDLKARAAGVCEDLGLPSSRLDVAVRDLSGGQAARAGLAAILLSRFDVFLLDEPTNDLDFAGLDRLEDFLTSLDGGAVIVSHDRAFLDRAVTRILEIEEGSRVGREFAGGWSEFVERRALTRRQQQQAYREFRTERQRLEERSRTQRSWAEQGVRKAAKKPADNDRMRRGFTVNRTEKQASKVRATDRALTRLATVDKPWEGWRLQLDLGGQARSGSVVARLEHAVIHRGPFSLGPVDLEVAWQDRIAVVGPNGGGKSTLLGALLGTVPLASGQRWVGPGVVIGELDQRRALLSSALSLLTGFSSLTGLEGAEARSLLAKFGLTASHVERAAGLLSPGERTRALLAVLMAGGVNCLVLDEPTNHLDLPAIEQLESALDDFAGTLILVTHDRWLLDAVRLDRRITVEGGRVHVEG